MALKYRINGYTEDEKIGIARNHLLPKQLAAHGLPPDSLRFRAHVDSILRGYTREAGLGNLERQIAEICRKAAHEVIRESDAEDEESKAIRLSQKRLEDSSDRDGLATIDCSPSRSLVSAIGLGKTTVAADHSGEGSDDEGSRQVDDHRSGR